MFGNQVGNSGVLFDSNTSLTMPTISQPSVAPPLMSFPTLSPTFVSAAKEEIEPNSMVNVPDASLPEPAAASVAAAASAISRLPDADSFNLFGDIEANQLPVIVQLPHGGFEQIRVPLDATVDDLKNSISLPRLSNDELSLSFGNSNLDPSATLRDTNIVDAYEHAGSLLHVIGNGVQDIDTKTAALASACEVIRSISNGVKDVESLCEVATNSEFVQNTSPNSTGNLWFKKEISFEEPSLSPTPSHLVHSLSRQLPDLFPREATMAAFPEEFYTNNTLNPEEAPSAVDAQPSLASIRDIRRANEASRSDPTIPPAGNTSVDDTIGFSTFSQPLPDDMDLDSVVSKEPLSSGVTPNVILAQSGKTTWLEDVMKTWGIGALCGSGVLEKTKDGQEVSDYLNELKGELSQDNLRKDNPEVDREFNHNAIANDQNGLSHRTQATSEHLNQDPECSNLKRSNAMRGPNIAVSCQQQEPEVSPFPVRPNEQIMPTLPPGVSHLNTFRNLPKCVPTHPHVPTAIAPAPTTMGQHADLPFPRAPNAISPSMPDFMVQPTLSSFQLSSPSPRSPKSGGNTLRKATKIAPAPGPGLTSHGHGGGTDALPLLQGCPPTTNGWRQPNPDTGGKDKNRKRKERDEKRKELNRESARQSRVRRKVIAHEYEDKINSLLSENSHLREQVGRLNGKLNYLQSILTVTVKQELQPLMPR